MFFWWLVPFQNGISREDLLPAYSYDLESEWEDAFAQKNLLVPRYKGAAPNIIFPYRSMKEILAAGTISPVSDTLVSCEAEIGPSL